MEYQVHGEDISEEEFSQDQGWQSAGARRAGAKTRTADSNAPSPQPGSRRGNSGGAALKSKVLRAGKMPSLPRDDIKIVIRPRGGLNISKIGAATVADAILAAAGISQEDFSRPRHDSSGRTRSRSRTPTTPKSKKKPTLSWADKAREGRESPRDDDSPRGSPHVKELDELRRANEQLRKENAQVKQEMSRLAAEIRRLASSPPSAQPASAPVAMDTSEAPHRSGAPKRRAVENTEKEETGNLLSELMDAFVNMQATLAKIQEAMTHPKMGLGALSERIRKLEEGDARGDPRPTPSQVAAQRNILAPPTEGAILTAALAAQPSPQPKYGE
ncbi:hypothetical protein HPB50_028815 [Hyalomma asiaticum]|nr:hypothetical protein HPB50_028815 [Hyalomma asiaticum]